MDLNASTSTVAADVTVAAIPSFTSAAFKAAITVRASILRSIAAWASSDTIRTPINAVHFDAGRVVATDGHRLVMVELLDQMTKAPSASADDPVPFTVPLDSIAAIVKLAGAKGIVQIDPARRTLRACAAPTKYATKYNGPALGATIGEVTWKDSGSPFPPWRQVIPDGALDPVLSSDQVKAAQKHGATPREGYTSLHAINPSYLEGMAAICHALADSKSLSSGVAIRPGRDPLDPVVYTFGALDKSAHGCRATFVIMPMRL